MPRRRVLLVDADTRSHDLLERHLEIAGYAVDHIADGRGTRGRAHDIPFDLILLDVALPGIDGFGLCRSIRDPGANTATPIVIVTAREDEADKVVWTSRVLGICGGTMTGEWRARAQASRRTTEDEAADRRAASITASEATASRGSTGMTPPSRSAVTMAA
jgi:DNA-binding response OmpR family regulator